MRFYRRGIKWHMDSRWWLSLDYPISRLPHAAWPMSNLNQMNPRKRDTSKRELPLCNP